MTSNDTLTSDSDMLAVQITKDRRTVLTRHPFPGRQNDQVVVDVELCGICGTDLHAANLPEVYRGGFVMGHEAVGRIRSVGDDVQGWIPGDRVAINPTGNVCGHCVACRAGRFNFCQQAFDTSLGMAMDGALAPRVATYPKTLHRLPEDMEHIAAAWIEPAATALRAVRQVGELVGRRVLVIGGGPIGQLSVRIARLVGAESIVLVEPAAERRAFGIASGADVVLDPGDDDIAGLTADAVVEASGSVGGASLALSALEPNGTIVVAGAGAGSALDSLQILLKEAVVRGSFTYVEEFADIIPMLASGALRVTDLTTSIVGLNEAPAAFEALKQARTMKVLIAPNGWDQ
jgi:2-desacetyl-2-hydroxyethyl bacteriochlorophyllide A dehydrogenase